MLRRAAVALVLTSTALTACSRKEPPPEPVPVQETPEPARPVTSDTAGAGTRVEAEARRLAEEADRVARATLTDMIFFQYDESTLAPEAMATLNQKVAVLRANPAARILIAGHADERGSLEYNVALGMRRALAAKEYLTGFGIEGSRIEVTSFGEERPLVEGSNESAWARNRRDEFTVTGGPALLVRPGT